MQCKFKSSDFGGGKVCRLWQKELFMSKKLIFANFSIIFHKIYFFASDITLTWGNKNEDENSYHKRRNFLHDAPIAEHKKIIFSY
jgi:hypothetical protein